MPFRSTTIRTGTPSRAFPSSASAKRSPTAPGRKPNWTMCTDDVARPMSSSIRGKKLVPPTSTSAVVAVLSSNASARSRYPT